MKAAYLSIGLLALLSPFTAAWSKDDREIFRIRDEIAAHEPDPSATFYDILGIKQSASFDDITKAYRVKTKALHPDKVKQRLKSESQSKDDGKKGAKGPSKSELEAAVKEASERQARLSLIANILKGPGRDRYEHFLSSGFPLWKGTDYYYDRYRPGLGTVLVGLFFVAGGGIHYLTMYMSWKRQKEFLERYIKFARETAWGGNLGIANVGAPAPAPVQQQDDGDDDEAGPPQPMNRRERRMQEKESKKGSGRGSNKKSRKAQAQSSSSSSSRDASAAPTGARKRVVAENGKVLVVDSLGDVYLEDEDEDGNVNEFLLDPNELVKPTIWDTAVIRIPVWAFHQTMRLHFGERNAAAAADAATDERPAGEAEDDSDGPAQNTPSSDSAGEDFELVSKSTDSLSKAAAKASGSQQSGKASKRKSRKR